MNETDEICIFTFERIGNLNYRSEANVSTLAKIHWFQIEYITRNFFCMVKKAKNKFFSNKNGRTLGVIKYLNSIHILINSICIKNIINTVHTMSQHRNTIKNTIISQFSAK